MHDSWVIKKAKPKSGLPLVTRNGETLGRLGAGRADRRPRNGRYGRAVLGRIEGTGHGDRTRRKGSRGGYSERRCI